MALTEAQMTGSEAFVSGEWRYERLEGIGHWIPLEAPDELNGLLIDFLGGS
jgi:pimeloyl-ACP methyl ester carboxylesterase